MNLSGDDINDSIECSKSYKNPNRNNQHFTKFFVEEILKPDFGSSQNSVENMKQSPSQEDNVSQIPDVNLPAWIYCTRYSDRPSSGPRKRYNSKFCNDRHTKKTDDDAKRPRTAFTDSQLHRLYNEFETEKYLSDDRRKSLAQQLNLSESQIKIWFQNRRAKLKKTNSSSCNTLAVSLMAQGLYNHSVRVKLCRGDL